MTARTSSAPAGVDLIEEAHRIQDERCCSFRQALSIASGGDVLAEQRAILALFDDEEERATA